MNKTDQLLRMLEHPERYTEQQWQEILADVECRELYSLIAKTRSALASKDAEERLTNEMIDKQWQRLATECHAPAVTMPLWRKIAAAAVVVIICVGIAIAAVHSGFWGARPADKPIKQTAQPSKEQADVQSQDGVEPHVDSLVVLRPRLFEEAPLEQILDELAARYGVEVEYRDNEARSLRLFYQWEPEYSLDKVVEMLNNFEAFTIHHEGNKLIVEPQDAK